MQINRKLTGSLASAQTGTLELQLPGNETTRSTTTQLQVTKTQARLGKPSGKVKSGNLSLSGSITKKAQGKVAVRIEYATTSGQLKTIKRSAKIAKGKWTTTTPLPAEAAAGEPVAVSVHYAGSAKRQLTGAQTATTVRL